MRASQIRLISLVPMTLMMLSMPEGVHALNQSAASLELSKALEKFQQTDGIQFKVEKSVSDDLIPFPLNQYERPNLTQILKGFNWGSVRDISGVWHTVVVTGRNGDGLIRSHDAPSPVPLRYRAPPKQVPEKYQGLPKTANYPIDLSDCHGQKCGVLKGKPGEDDVASTLRVTGPVVAQFSACSSR